MEVINELQAYLSDSEGNTPKTESKTAEKMDTSDSEFEDTVDGPAKLPITVATSSSVGASPRVDVKEPKEKSNNKIAKKLNGIKKLIKTSTTSIVNQAIPSTSATTTRSTVNLFERFRYIPLRLTEHERKLLNVLINALEVCEYTDVVDVTFSHTRKNKYSRIVESIIDMMSITCGLMLATDLQKGEGLAEKVLHDNIPWFADIFEIGRRYKIMNPSKMRTTYGKMMYLLMDAESSMVKDQIPDLKFIKPLQTIYTLCEKRQCLEILEDPLWLIASGYDKLLASQGFYRMSKKMIKVNKIKNNKHNNSRHDSDDDEDDGGEDVEEDKEDGDDDEDEYNEGSSSRGQLARQRKAIQRAQAKDALLAKYAIPSAPTATVPSGTKTASASAAAADSNAAKLTAEEVIRIIDSLADDVAYSIFNVRPVQRALELLTDHFNEQNPSGDFSLSLTGRSKNSSNFGSNSSSKGNNNNNMLSSFTSLYSGGYGGGFGGYGGGMGMGGGNGGAMLTHSHTTQYRFVYQSLTLWKEIMTFLPKLWYLADYDMTTQAYRLVDTGQGYQRLQSCPKVSNEMHRILSFVQSKVQGNWVGLSVIHLADRDVPNALMFIDKYIQVPRILAPLAHCIDHLPNLSDDAAFLGYIQSNWGNLSNCRLAILTDFFKHAYDGSGDDGGSCIDGRLTSAWNWCSKLHKKDYYHVFMATGFQGFDGSDWKTN